MNRIATVLSCIFGYLFLALSFFVTLETIMRKVFNVSFQGADELGGYALAVGSSLAFSIALIGRGHIRIDVLHSHLPPTVQAILNWLSAVLLGLFGMMLITVCYKVVSDTIDYGSTAPTPWATPMIYPQSVWFFSLLAFAAIAIVYAYRATALLLMRRRDELNEEFHPKGAFEELAEEIEDISHRG